jgi:mono/diheme cytochrome c family protein
LKNVSQRKDRPWLVKFLQDPKGMIESGDPYAVKLQGEARGVVMPTVAGMSPERAQLLLDMIEAESKLAKSQFAGLQISNRPFTPQEIAQGEALFAGQTKLAGGGPSCVSCHTMRGLPGLSGGRLGPDLTLVYERLQGRKGLAQWLVAPASPTMAPIFKQQALRSEEILPLVAYFEAAAKQGGADDSASLVNFFLLGLGGMVVGLVSLDALWKRRFRSVRRVMVQKARRKVQ